MTAVAISRVAWVGPAPAHVEALPWRVEVHTDSDAFLLADAPFSHDAYIVTTQQVGVAGLELVALLRQRTDVPLLVLDAPGLPALADALQRGADMVLPWGVAEDAIVAAMHAVVRRSHAELVTAHWVVSTTAPRLTSPGGRVVELSDTEHAIMLGFVDADGAAVARQTLVEQIWGPDAGAMDNSLHAAMYRLRRRIEAEIGELPPIRSVPRVGYAFDATIKRDR